MSATLMDTSENDDFAVQASDALHAACAAVGLSVRGARLIRLFASAVYHLPEADAVARIARSTAPQPITKAMRALSVTKWLAATYDFSTVTPVIERPIETSGCVVTFWHYLPQDGPAPTTVDLAVLLKRLHTLPDPPISLPVYRPLRSVERAIMLSRALTEEERNWLEDHCRRLKEEYERLEFSLPTGMIHGDAWRGNVLRGGARAVLADWDEVSHGPREMDLLPTLVAGRFGLPADDRAAFIATYGHDITGSPGCPVLRDIRELSTLTALLMNAHRDARSLHELRRRMLSIQTGDDRRWTTF